MTLVQDEEQRIQRLEKYVKKAEASLNSLNLALQNGELEPFSEEQIRFHLSHDPDMIADAGLLLAKFKRALSYAQLDCQTIKSELWKECNIRKDELGLTNANDRNAFVNTQPKYIEAQKMELEYKYRVEQMTVIYERYMNLFHATRKLASLIIDFNKVQDAYTNY